MWSQADHSSYPISSTYRPVIWNSSVLQAYFSHLQNSEKVCGVVKVQKMRKMQQLHLLSIYYSCILLVTENTGQSVAANKCSVYWGCDIALLF